MVQSTTRSSQLELLLPHWHGLLQGWAQDGSILRAATEALHLNEERPQLKKLVSQWARGDFSSLPPIQLLPATSMPGAAGAYALSNDTIYLNDDWLQGASVEHVLAVLTEELGHHLDGLLNSRDTPGDEGEYFATLLINRHLSVTLRTALNKQLDERLMFVDDMPIKVELSSGPDVQAPSIQSFSLDLRTLEPLTPGGELLTGQLAIRDNLSGFSGGSFVFYSPSGQSLYLNFSHNNLVSGSAVSGRYSGSGSLKPFAESGVWSLESINLSDNAGNRLRKYASDVDWSSFLSSNGITQTSFTVDYGGSQPPVITLALSTPSVAEDGSTNLVYTFTRSGSTTDPLTVNYTVSGSATLRVDYTGIAPTPATKSITLAAGSATATVSVDPTADRTQEANETVALQLVSGATYTLGTTSAVTGTIRNDDLIGTTARNTIVGTSVTEFIDGFQANDTLTGGVGPDVFGFRYSHSTLTAPDRITDFRFGTDKIDLFTSTGGALAAPAGFTRASTNNTATNLSALATAVFSDANGALKGNQALGANRAALVVATKSSIRGTYLFINDGNAGRNNTNDLLVNITGLSGSLPGLGVIPVASVFT